MGVGPLCRRRHNVPVCHPGQRTCVISRVPRLSPRGNRSAFMPTQLQGAISSWTKWYDDAAREQAVSPMPGARGQIKRTHHYLQYLLSSLTHCYFLSLIISRLYAWSHKRITSSISVPTYSFEIDYVIIMIRSHNPVMNKSWYHQ